MPQILLYDEKEMHVFDVVNYHPEEPLVEPVTPSNKVCNKYAANSQYSKRP